MSILVLGLLIFLGTHSIRIVADDWRSAKITRLGEQRWKAIYAIASAIGLGLTIWGYGIAREAPLPLWQAPLWTRHLAALLTLPAFILIVAAYVPGTRIRAAIGHPMVLGVALWALAHLAANGTLADLLLFGGFLLWAAADFVSARGRDRAAGTTYAVKSLAMDGAAIGVGIVTWVVFARYLHASLIGVQPFG